MATSLALTREVAPQALTAGAARLSVLEGVTGNNDLGPFVRGAIDAKRTTLRTDGFGAYLTLASTGIRHERHIQGSDRSRSTELLLGVLLKEIRFPITDLPLS